MENKNQVDRIELPENVSADYNSSFLSMKGPKGELRKKIPATGLKIGVEGASILIESSKGNKRSRKAIGSLKAHIRNYIKGVTEGHLYRMKICSGHFPMSVAVAGNEFVVKNFFGEKYPRKIKICPEVKVKIDGQEVVIESVNKEAASQFAASVETMTRRNNFDRRVFMDGIYITSKDGKEIR
ncbi:50S ribosomal protein L6 [Candidatus Woesearchaeota archaeon]|nr:50S ribosomal protein L6 [Candidatus Woesearchaeota archaeon]